MADTNLVEKIDVVLPGFRLEQTADVAGVEIQSIRNHPQRHVLPVMFLDEPADLFHRALCTVHRAGHGQHGITQALFGFVGCARRCGRCVGGLRDDPDQQLWRDGEHPLLRQVRGFPVCEQLVDELARSVAIAIEHELPELGLLGKRIRRCSLRCLCDQRAQRVLEIGLFYGFEQIVRHTGADAGAHILEIVKARQHQHFDHRIFTLGLSCKLQTTHHRHLQIRDEDVTGRAAQQCQRIAAIACLARKLKPKPVPVNHFLQSLDDEPLIIDEHHTKRSFHLSPPLCAPSRTKVQCLLRHPSVRGR